MHASSASNIYDVERPVIVGGSGLTPRTKIQDTITQLVISFVGIRTVNGITFADVSFCRYNSLTEICGNGIDDNCNGM